MIQPKYRYYNDGHDYGERCGLMGHVIPREIPAILKAYFYVATVIIGGASYVPARRLIYSHATQLIFAITAT